MATTLESGRKVKDITGETFGNWKVIAEVESRRSPSGRLHRQFDCINLVTGEGRIRNLKRLSESRPKSLKRLSEPRPSVAKAPPASRIGSTYGDWKILAKGRILKTAKSKNHSYLCQCKCGYKKEIRQSNIANGTAPKTCDSCKPLAAKQYPAGTKFGKLTVVEESHVRITEWGGRVRYFNLTCDCGRTTQRTLDSLRSSSESSCGNCLGLSGDPNEKAVRVVWRDMVARCYMPTCSRYPDYGAKGITVQWSWLPAKHGGPSDDSGFSNFCSYVLSEIGPKPYELRRNKDGEMVLAGWHLDKVFDTMYCEVNIQWLTATENAKKAKCDGYYPSQVPVDGGRESITITTEVIYD